MKNILTVFLICAMSSNYIIAQENNQGKAKSKLSKSSTVIDKEENKVSDNDTNYTFGKIGRTIPDKIEEAFKKDYPNAANPIWSKLKLDWTVTFGNGTFRSIATYYPNGDRRDTRTHLFVQQAPKPVMEEIVKRYPIFKQKRVILKLEEPGKQEIYNINVSEGGKTVSISFDRNGKEIR